MYHIGSHDVIVFVRFQVIPEDFWFTFFGEFSIIGYWLTHIIFISVSVNFNTRFHYFLEFAQTLSRYCYCIYIIFYCFEALRGTPLAFIIIMFVVIVLLCDQCI